MKKFLPFVFWALSFASYAQDIDALHYGYLLSLGDENDTIIGVAFITFQRKAGVSSASFELTEVGENGKGMKVSNVSVGDKTDKALPFLHTDGKITIELPPNNTLDTFTVSIAYAGKPADGLIISKNKYGDRTFFADNWPNRAHHWIPCIDKPDDKASFHFYVAAPSHYTVVSNGVKGEVKDYGTRKLTTWIEDTPQPTKVMVIGVAKFATKVFDDSPPDIPISAWVYPQDSVKGFHDYAITPSIVKFFSDYIGPFPYKKLANVQSKTIFGGMENASAIFYAENSVTGDQSEEDLMAHEIAHQWFGDAASEKSFAHLWLSEGFATYFTNIYFEKKYGREKMNERLKKDREAVIAFAKSSNKPVVDTSSNLMSLLNANSYQKGGWVLHMLRQEVGDSAFQKIIQTYYNTYKGSNADSRDFEAIAEKVSEKELTPFFDQWLFQPSIPSVFLSWKYEKGNIVLSSPGELSRQRFRVKIQLQIVYADGENTTVELQLSTNESAVYKIPSKQKPLRIIVDPATNLLFEGKILELK